MDDFGYTTLITYTARNDGIKCKGFSVPIPEINVINKGHLFWPNINQLLQGNKLLALGVKFTLWCVVDPLIS